MEDPCEEDLCGAYCRFVEEDHRSAREDCIFLEDYKLALEVCKPVADHMFVAEDYKFVAEDYKSEVEDYRLSADYKSQAEDYHRCWLADFDPWAEPWSVWWLEDR